MKAQELRIGNYVTIDNPKAWPSLKGLPMRVTEYHAERDNDFPNSTGSISVEDDDRDSYGQFDEFIKPIPLTEDWLNRMGLEWDIYWQGHTDGNWVLTPGNDSGNWRIAYGKRRTDTIVYDIKYVHQLQNLYFTLTGKELTLTL